MIDTGIALHSETWYVDSSNMANHDPATSNNLALQWLPLGLLDPAGFLQLLCNACLNLECLRLGTNPPENLEAMKYHNRAVQYVLATPAFLQTKGLY